MRIDYRHSEFNRGFGVELEVGPEVSKTDIGFGLLNFEYSRELPRMVHVEDGPKGWAESRNNDYWHVKYDSSCGPIGKKIDHGWEIASFVGFNEIDLRHIASGTRVIRDIGCKVNDNCGLHYHVSVLDMDVKDVSILMARWLKFEHVLLQSVPVSRKNNKWCRPLRNKLPKKTQVGIFPIDTPEQLWLWMCPKNLSVHENYDKRVTLNFINFARSLNEEFNDRSTIELRLPECILEEEHVYYWGMWFLNFVDSTLYKDFPKSLDPAKTLDEALIYMGLTGENGEFMILDGPLHQTKIWFLQRVARNATIKKLANRATDLLEYIGRI
jgi:hypothetical protein